MNAAAFQEPAFWSGLEFTILAEYCLAIYFLHLFIGVGVEIVDQCRVSGHLRRQAAKLLELRQVRGRTWLRPRIYQIKYRDMNGWEHIAQCKVSALRGIHYCDDEVIGLP